ASRIRQSSPWGGGSATAPGGTVGGAETRSPVTACGSSGNILGTNKAQDQSRIIPLHESEKDRPDQGRQDRRVARLLGKRLRCLQVAQNHWKVQGVPRFCSIRGILYCPALPHHGSHRGAGGFRPGAKSRGGGEPGLALPGSIVDLV